MNKFPLRNKNFKKIYRFTAFFCALCIFFCMVFPSSLIRCNAAHFISQKDTVIVLDYDTVTTESTDIPANTTTSTAPSTEQLTTEEMRTNDPLLKHQWWLSPIYADKAWDYGICYTGYPVIVAVIDTGIYYKHEDLKDHIWENPGEISGNKKDDDHNGYVNDCHGWDFYNNDSSVYSSTGTGNGLRADTFDNDNHGTHVAGILAATANNNRGIAGIASNINLQIMPLKTFGGVSGSGSTKNIIKAIRYAENKGAKIVNVSWNFSKSDPELYQTIQESNMLFVCSAGNDGINVDKQKSYPCCYDLPNVVSVTSVDNTLTFCKEFANYGKKSIDLAAPGQDILSTVIGGYSTMYGTSMSTPIVTGAAALAYAANTKLRAADLKKVLRKSITKRTDLKSKTVTGGVINIDLAVQNARKYKVKKDNIKPKIKATITKNKNSVTCHIKASDSGGSHLRLVRYAVGKKKAAYFQKGKKGRKINNNKITFSRKTIITVYALDHAGNAVTKRMTLKPK